MAKKNQKFEESDKKEIVRLYLEEKLNPRQIAIKYECSQKKIRNVIDKSGVKKRSISEGIILSSNTFTDNEIKKIIRLYEEDKLNSIEIGQIINKSKSSIERAIKSYGDPSKYRDRSITDLNRRKITEEEGFKLKELYETDITITLRDLKKHISEDVTIHTISAAIKRAGGIVRDSHEAAIRKTRAFTDAEVEEFCRLQTEDGKSIREIAEIFNADYGTICRSIDLYGSKERQREVTFWDKQKILDYGRELVKDMEELPPHSVLEKNHSGWNAAIARYYEGGKFQLAIDLGIKPKQKNYSNISEINKKELCDLYRYGYTLRDLSFKFNIRRETCAQVLEESGIKRRDPGGGGDCMESVLASTGRYAITRECEYYIVGIKGYPEQIKPGISFDKEDRSSKSDGLYENEYLVKQLNSREEAFFLEESILAQTISYFDAPEELINDSWGGWTELRKMQPNELIRIFDYFYNELEDLGMWKFAATYVPMTQSQKEECERRAAKETNG